MPRSHRDFGSNPQERSDTLGGWQSDDEGSRRWRSEPHLKPLPEKPRGHAEERKSKVPA